MEGGFPGNNLDKDSRPSDPYPTGRHTRGPERTRKWRPDRGEAIVPSVSVAIPMLGCHFTVGFLKLLKLSVTWAWHHWGQTAISFNKKREAGPLNWSQVQRFAAKLNHSSMLLCSLYRFRWLCGKCVSEHICVMWCSSQVLEASFHCVTFWHHPGLLALPSAAVKH